MRAADARARGADAGTVRNRDARSLTAGRAGGGRRDDASGRPDRLRSAWRAVWRFLSRPRGDRLWDIVIRTTGLLGLLGIGLVLLFPPSGPLVGLGIYTMWVTGPLSPFFPVGLEPVLMLFGRLYPPLLVAGLATVAGLYIEFLNYYLYGTLLGLDRARRFRESRTVRFLQRLFGRAPFFTVWVSAWTPLPFWGARILAALSDYPVGRYLVATALGRFPKLWFFSALGMYWGLNGTLLLGVVVGTTLLATVLWLVGRRRGEAGVRLASRPPRALTREAGTRAAPREAVSA